MLFRLGRVWFFSTIAKLIQFSQPRGVEMRWRPYIAHAGDRCEVRRYKGEVSITLISVLDIMPLAVIYVVVYIWQMT
jgi:hypothetical protein